MPPLTGTVTFKDGATILGTGTLSGSPTATATFSTNGLATGSHTITAIYSGDSNFAGSTSGNFTQTVNPGPFAKLQLLVPGETAAPGTTTGKTGTPTAQIGRHAAFTVTVNAVDAQLEPGQHQRYRQDHLQRRQRHPAGQRRSRERNEEPSASPWTRWGSSTITATDVTHTGIAASTSPPITVGDVAPVAQTRPVVAIHDSELTRALETLPATGSTPLGTGNHRLPVVANQLALLRHA